jgi:hypothetical protein
MELDSSPPCGLKRATTSTSSSSESKKPKLDLPQDQRDALIIRASQILEYLGDIPNVDSDTLISFLFIFVHALKSTDLGSKIVQPSQIMALLHDRDGPLDDWKRAFLKGVNEKDWIDLIGFCTCHFTPDA